MNRRAALTRAEQQQNLPAQRRGESQHRGVYRRKQSGRWVAQGRANGKTVNIGTFDSELDAAHAAADFRRRHMTHPEHGDNPIHIGRIVRKVRSGREGQITAITETHAVVHWPDYESFRNNPEQTYVRLDRFRRTREWELL